MTRTLDTVCAVIAPKLTVDVVSKIVMCTNCVRIHRFNRFELALSEKQIPHLL